MRIYSSWFNCLGLFWLNSMIQQLEFLGNLLSTISWCELPARPDLFFFSPISHIVTAGFYIIVWPFIVPITISTSDQWSLKIIGRHLRTHRSLGLLALFPCSRHKMATVSEVAWGKRWCFCLLMFFTITVTVTITITILITTTTMTLTIVTRLLSLMLLLSIFVLIMIVFVWFIQIVSR